jgi:hypothetical protein
MKNALAFSVLLVAVLIVGGLVLVKPAGEVAILGAGGDAFAYKHYTSVNASSTKGTVVFGGAGVLGAMTVGSSSAATKVIIYDGASTATSGMSVIATFVGTLTPGTYDFNVAVNKGVVVELPATFNGAITFSVR